MTKSNRQMPCMAGRECFGMKDFFDLIRMRQSCRSFSEKPVEKEKIVRCVEAARLAPSACNSQPWGFVVVNGGKLRESAAQSAQGAGANHWAENCPAFVAVVERSGLAGEPVDQKWGKFNLGLAAMQFCLAATEQGLSTCMIGAFDEEKAKKAMRLSPEERLCLLIAVGYAADGDPLRKKDRRSLRDVLRFAE
ncbi:MAG TPA: NAD(P)H nitroreductase [Ruminococcaceae bacterium]|nr:NAD(P)H nitroreductase [Oscillospiraceae bacterium]